MKEICFSFFDRELVAELPFTLMHPKPKEAESPTNEYVYFSFQKF